MFFLCHFNATFESFYKGYTGTGRYLACVDFWRRIFPDYVLVINIQRHYCLYQHPDNVDYTCAVHLNSRHPSCIIGKPRLFTFCVFGINYGGCEALNLTFLGKLIKMFLFFSILYCLLCLYLPKKAVIC